MEDVYNYVFQNEDCMAIIFKYQNGIPGIIKQRIDERLQTIIIPLYYSYRLPSGFRPLKCSRGKYLDKEKIQCTSKRNKCFGLHLAIAEGELVLVKQFWEYVPWLFSHRAMICAINFKQCEIIQFLHPLMRLFGNEDVYRRNIKRSFETLTIRDGVSIDAYLPLMSKEQPELSDIKRMFKRKWTRAYTYKQDVEKKKYEEYKASLTWLTNYNLELILKQLGSEGQLDCIKAFFEQVSSKQICSTNVPDMAQKIVFCQASKAGHIDVLYWMYDQLGYGKNGEFDDLKKKEIWPKIVAARGVDNLAVVEFLQKLGYPLSNFCPFTVEVAEFLIFHGVKITTRHLEWAVGDISGVVGLGKLKSHLVKIKSNLFNIVKFYDQTYRQARLRSWTSLTWHRPFREEHICTAAKFGLVEIVKYLHENVCKISSHNNKIMELAIKSGSLDIIKYLHEVVGCPIPCSALKLAITNMDTVEGEIDYMVSPYLQYIVNQGKHIVWDAPSVLEFTPLTFETMQWLLNECKNSQNWQLLRACVRFGQIDILSEIMTRTITTMETMEAANKFAQKLVATNIIEYLQPFRRNHDLAIQQFMGSMLEERDTGSIE